jgi:hypothetical protein
MSSLLTSRFISPFPVSHRLSLPLSCPSSSAWPHVAQELIGANIPAGPDGSGFEVKASNQFVDCTSTPITGAVFHLPNGMHALISAGVSWLSTDLPASGSKLMVFK